MPIEKRSKEYVKALRVKEISFPGEPDCLFCPYCRTKSGLYGKGELNRYENTLCVLTYETLYSRNSESKEFLKGKGKGVGKYCPLEFPNPTDRIDQTDQTKGDCYDQEYR